MIITGHPATGKTTLGIQLAESLSLPLVSKDQIKETLSESFVGTGNDHSRQLSRASWALLYQSVEMLLKSGTSFIVESNFDPTYANLHWQALRKKYRFEPVQIRCETDPDVLLSRYKARIHTKERHQIHVDASQNPLFIASIQTNIGWIDIESRHLSYNTTKLDRVMIDDLIDSIKLQPPK